MKSNRIILIMLFFGIGYFLYFRERSGPMNSFWKIITNIFEPKSLKSAEENPYKAPENIPATGETTLQAQAATLIFDKIKDNIFGNDDTEVTSNGDGSEIPDFALPAIRKKDEIIKHKNYVLRYEEAYEVPAWVVHKLRGEYTKGTASRGDNQFMPDRKVRGNSALSSDYSNTGYDRGHLVPAGDFKCCQELMTETFFMSNIAPQTPNFNRGIWENIESRVRRWAVRDEELFIVTGPVLREGLPTIGRYNQVAIPEYFYKIVLFYQPKSDKIPRAIAFLLPNEDLPERKRMSSYVVSVDEVEKRTGLDFFAKLPAIVQRKVEASSDWEAWTKVQ